MPSKILIERAFSEKNIKDGWKAVEISIAALSNAPAPSEGVEKEFCAWLGGYLKGIQGRDGLTMIEANTIRNTLNEMYNQIVPADTEDQGPDTLGERA